MNGVDHVEPHTAIPALVRKLSSLPRSPRAASTLPAYVAAVRTAVDSMRPDLETVTGELRGGTTTRTCCRRPLKRVYLKQQTRAWQTLLEPYAEPLVRFASLSERLSAGALRYAWKTCANHPA